MSRYPIADKVGIAQIIIKKALGKHTTEKDLFKFLHGDVNTIYETLPKPSNLQSWETTGKRYVHLEEARFVANYLLRNGTKPVNERALVLSGTDPALACLPWIMSGISYTFDAFEKDADCYDLARTKLFEERGKLQDKAPPGKKTKLNLLLGDVLTANNKYGVIDLDFCNNHLRTEYIREKILRLIGRVSPDKGPFILRTTLHVGRASNSKEDVSNNIEAFDGELRRGSAGYRIKAHNQSPYQSSLPMMSLVWILERKEQIETAEPVVSTDIKIDDLKLKIYTYPNRRGPNAAIYLVEKLDGKSYITNNLIQFSKENKLHAPNLYRSAKAKKLGKEIIHKGFTCRKIENPQNIQEIIDTWRTQEQEKKENENTSRTQQGNATAASRLYCEVANNEY